MWDRRSRAARLGRMKASSCPYRSPAASRWRVWAGLLCLLAACGDSPALDPALQVAAAQVYGADGSALGALPEPKHPRNLVVIVLSSLRGDVLDAPAETSAMPYLASLADSGLRFTQASVCAPAGAPSMASQLTGLLPTEHACLDETSSRLQESVVTYAEVLERAYGYETAVLSDVPWYRGAAGTVLQGFRYQDLPSAGRKPATGRESGQGSAPAQVAQVEEPSYAGFSLHAAEQGLDRWLAQRDSARPYFLLLHSFDTHSPYGAENHQERGRWNTADWGAYDAQVALAEGSRAQTPPDWVRTHLTDLAGRVALARSHPSAYLPTVRSFLWQGFRDGAHPDLAAELRGAYMKGARWADQGLERCVKALEARGLLKDTLFVVTSDHGEAFAEHGTVGHGHLLHDEVLRVPLVLRGPPPFDRARHRPESVGLLDILPTYCEWAGVTRIPQGHGRSLLPLLRGESAGHAVIAEWAVQGPEAPPGVRSPGSTSWNTTEPRARSTNRSSTCARTLKSRTTCCSGSRWQISPYRWSSVRRWKRRAGDSRPRSMP